MKHLAPFSRILLILCLGLALLVGIVTAVEARPIDAPAETVTSYARYTLLTSNGITQTVNGTGVRIAGYEDMDCFGTIDVTLPQTVTLALQVGVDGTNYAAVATFAAQSADTTIYTRTLVYGEYYRAAVTTLGGVNPVTVTVKCVAKN